MRPRILVAGVGNVFLGDDGFGVEVVRRLASAGVPEGVTVADVGIGGMHLAYELADGGYDLLVLVDAMPLAAAPGTVEVTAVDDRSRDRAIAQSPHSASVLAHDLDPIAMLEYVRALGATPPPVVVVGCQPASIEEGMGLSEPVAAAVEPAVQAVRHVLRKPRMANHASHMTEP